MNINKININQSEASYYIALDIYDVSAHNNDATFASLSELLFSENLYILIPTSVRCGGMTIRFVQSSDNKYVQYRLTSSSFSTNEADWWEVVDGTVTTEKINFQQVTYPTDGMICGINGKWSQYLKPTSMQEGQSAKGTIILRGYNNDTCTLIGSIYTGLANLFSNIILFDSEFNEVGLYRNDTEEFSEYFSVMENGLHKLVLDWNYIITLNENTRFVGVTLIGTAVKISSLKNYQWATSISIYDKKIAHVTTELIKNGAVTTDKLADGAITLEKIEGGGITRDMIKYWDLPVFNNGLYCVVSNSSDYWRYFSNNNGKSGVAYGLSAIVLKKTAAGTQCDVYSRFWLGDNSNNYYAFIVLDSSYNVIAPLMWNDELFSGRVFDALTGAQITTVGVGYSYKKISVPIAEIIEKYPTAYYLAFIIADQAGSGYQSYIVCERDLALKVDLSTVLKNLPTPYKITTNQIADKTITANKIADDVIKTLSSGSLAGSTWYCCGDSFSEGDFSNSTTPSTSYQFQDGVYKGKNKVYSRFIALRNNMNLQLLAKCGATLGLRKDSINWGSDDFDAFNDIPYSPSKVTFNSSTITSVVLKTPSDENAGCCSFMSQGDNIFTYNSSLGWVYNSEQSATDISKFLTVTGTPNTGDTITVRMSKANNGFYNQFREIEAGKTEEEQRQFKGYITSWFGINDSNKCKLGTITDETLDTFYGSLNWWAINIIQKFPLAHIGFIVTNKCNSTFKQAIRDVAQKWAIPYLDMDGDVKIPSVSGTRDSVASLNIEVDPRLATYRWNNTFRVSSSNGHPNEFAHEWQSTFIENWLRTL